MAGLAQFTDKGDNVEVEKGTKLCSNIKMETAKGSSDIRASDPPPPGSGPSPVMGQFEVGSVRHLVA